MKLFRVLTTLLVVASSSAFAHTGHAIDARHTIDAQTSFVHGLLHPLTGLDHLIYIIAVGIALSLVSRGYNWKYIGGYLLLFSVGLVLGSLGLLNGSVEMLLASSVLIAGLSIAMFKKNGVHWMLVLAILGAAVHGFAHAVEMPGEVTPSLYFLGLVVASLGVLASAAKLGQWLGCQNSDLARRTIGCSIAAIVFLVL